MKKFIKTCIAFWVAFLFVQCANAPKQLPQNPIDDPVIIPKKMNVHRFKMNRDLIENSDAFWGYVILPGVIPGRGIGKNVDMPYLLTPYFRILLNKNDFYETGKITPKKFYNVVSTGAFPIGYSDRMGLNVISVFGWEVSYRSEEWYRLDFPFLMAYGRDNFLENLEAAFHPQFSLKLNQNSMLVLGPKIYAESSWEKPEILRFNSYEEIQKLEFRQLANIGYRNRFESNWDFYGSAAIGARQNKQNHSQRPSSDIKAKLDWDFQAGLIWHW